MESRGLRMTDYGSKCTKPTFRDRCCDARPVENMSWGLIRPNSFSKKNRRLISLAIFTLISCITDLRVVSAQSQTQNYFDALGYTTYSHPGGLYSSPEALCAGHAEIWGWNKNGYSVQTIQVEPGYWHCQRYYNGQLEPSWVWHVFGVCQTQPSPILTGSDQEKVN